ncbi:MULTISPECIES: YbaN family protein [Desulfitobacterium]|nr:MULTISPECIES: YbaN family protein [Desulfitobacterium]EHL06976.1 hypothetical protein HMPREF0322_02389 [Desulfitobacterium hafniense DP7]KTE91231.1 hypothetical protein AT727_06455 [Desulfitobacterium hafniense]MEA5023854.1 YbaN family protein [Desulfitobacterium hafniense]
MMKMMLIGIGTLCVVLGIIGVFLPVVPTTPFLLLAGACYMRSSPRLHKRLLASKWLGSYLKDYYENKGMTLHAKAVSISCLWLSLTISMFFVEIIGVRLLLLGIGLAVTLFLLSRKTKKSETCANPCGDVNRQKGTTKE